MCPDGAPGDRETMADFALATMTPQAVVTPANAEELAQALREAAEAGHAVVPWGGGTRQHIGGPPARYDLALSTAGLARVVAYHPEDLVITVEAGATLGAVQAELARHGQWLPWDPPLPERATVGGLLASAAAGPLRLGFGAPRDWTLGMRVALGDGRLVRSGGRVVKNVAGYDTHKLQIGALGTLGVIVEATFKVQPLPEQRRTLLAAFTDAHLPGKAIAALRAAPLEPIAVVALNQAAEEALPMLRAFLPAGRRYILVAAHYAGTGGAVSRQLREGARRCVELGARTIELREEDDQGLWDGIADLTAPAGDGSLLLRVAVAGADVTLAASKAGLAATARGWRPAQLAVGGPGLVYSRWPIAGADPAQVAAALAELRAELAAAGGYAVVEEAPAGLALDRWGAAPPGLAIMRALRASWDPRGALNPGRFLL